MLLLSWQLTLLALGIVPIFVYLTYRVGRARRRLSGQTQESLAELSALTEETLSVSGVLLTKVFDRRNDAVERYRDENRRLARLQVRQSMVGRSFFALVQTFFSVAPALVYLVAGARAPELGHDRRVHRPADPAAVPDRPDAADRGRGAGVARALRAGLPVPRPAARHRRRRGRADALARARCAARSRCGTSGSATRSRRRRSSTARRRRRLERLRAVARVDAGGRLAGGRAGPARRDRRPERRRQDDDLVPDPAALRHGPRQRRARRHRRAGR